MIKFLQAKKDISKHSFINVLVLAQNILYQTHNCQNKWNFCICFLVCISCNKKFKKTNIKIKTSEKQDFAALISIEIRRQQVVGKCASVNELLIYALLCVCERECMSFYGSMYSFLSTNNTCITNYLYYFTWRDLYMPTTRVYHITYFKDSMRAFVHQINY